ncbi:unnamed protein product [Alopecurus aequalis]
MAVRLADGGEKKVAMAGDEDRIGVLPDDVSQLLLSFLPSRDAVRTCVLATRWRTLWKSVPSLRTDTSNWMCAHDSNRFVNNLLHYRDRTAPLDVCEISSYDDEDDDEGCLYIEQWVQYAVSCKARDGSVDLSSCHALEVLKVQDCVLNLVGVFSKSLRRLKIARSHHLTRTYCTSISAPGLVDLELTNCSYWTLVLESLPSLVTAFIFIGEKDECAVCYSSSNDSSEESYDEADDRDDCVTLQGLADATDLKLITRSPMDFLNGLEDCSVFSKLKTLLLNEWCVAANFTGLVYFLQHSPNLERLRLEPDGAEEFASESEICESYNPREHFWVSKHLKVVKILYCGEDEIIDQIRKILCTHGVPPELIDIEYH